MKRHAIVITSTLALMLLSFPEFTHESAFAETTESSASMCAQILSVGHFISKGVPSLYPFFVEVRTVKNMSDKSDQLLLSGHISKFRIHSPSQMFATPEDKLQGKFFKLNLLQNPKGWVLASAQEDSNECR